MIHINQMKMEEYIKEFNVFNETLLEFLYKCILNKFQIKISDEKYSDYEIFLNEIFRLIESLREKEDSFISEFLLFISTKNIHLGDIIILLWCLPFPGKFISKTIYDNHYKHNIDKYNIKMINIISNTVMKNFCIESLTKTNYIPIHCIDYLWYYMSNIIINLRFIGYDRYIFIEYKNENSELYMHFCIDYLFDNDLGNVIYPTDPFNKRSFQEFLKTFLLDNPIKKSLISNKHLNNFYERNFNS